MAAPSGPIAIESLATGAEIYAYDQDRRENVVARVIAASSGQTACWVDVVLEEGVVRATRHHPIWVEGEQAWRDALALTVGTVVRLGTGRNATVRGIAIRPLETLEPTFNVTVDPCESYFAGAPALLVHNGTPLGQPGHSVYVLVRRTRGGGSKIYYVGRFGPNESQASVTRRHRATPKVRPKGVLPRMGRADRMVILHRNLTYAEARRLEHELCVKNKTHIGRGRSWRGNRAYPMDQRKFGKYYHRC